MQQRRVSGMFFMVFWVVILCPFLVYLDLKTKKIFKNLKKIKT